MSDTKHDPARKGSLYWQVRIIQARRAPPASGGTWPAYSGGRGDKSHHATLVTSNSAESELYGALTLRPCTAAAVPLLPSRRMTRGLGTKLYSGCGLPLGSTVYSAIMS